MRSTQNINPFARPLIYLLLLLFSSDAFALFPHALRKIDKTCDLRNSNTKQLKELVHKVSIRGEDNREVSEKYNGTIPLACNKQGDIKTSGSINLIKGPRALTVLHNLVKLDTCEPIAKADDCYVYDGELLYPVKWEKDPVALCKENGGKEEIIVATFEGPIPKRKIYEPICEDRLDKNGLDTVKVVGSEAENFKSPEFTLGRTNIVGDGKVYNFIKEQRTLTYENDTGSGTSGGAIIGKVNGKEYLIGIHVGDKYGPEEEKVLKEKGTMDGLEGNAKTFYGHGITLGKEIAECR